MQDATASAVRASRRLEAVGASLQAVVVAAAGSAGSPMGSAGSPMGSSRFADPEDWSSPTKASPAEPTSGCKLLIGTNNFGTRITNTAEVLGALAGLGIDEIDTARAYNSGKSEEALGAAFAADPATAAQLTVGSKVTWMKLGYQQVNDDLAASLSALGKDCLDIYYLHAPDHTASLLETLRAVHEAHAAGQFKEFGVSNFRPWQLVQIINLMEQHNWSPLPTVYQGAYNAVQRDAESDLLPLCRRG